MKLAELWYWSIKSEVLTRVLMRFEVLMQVSDKPPEVRVNSLLTPRSISQRSKIRMHARRYHPKKDSPKVILEHVAFLPASFCCFYF